jgi:hypothetical protein
MDTIATKGEELLTEFWAKVWNPPYDLNTIDRLCTEDFVITNAGIDIVGRAAFKEWINAFTSKIREPRLVSHDMFSSLDGSALFPVGLSLVSIEACSTHRLMTVRCSLPA